MKHMTFVQWAVWLGFIYSVCSCQPRPDLDVYKRQLFKRYKDSVYFMILKMVNNRTDAEDLMFEAFEKAFASLNYYSPQFAFSTWLFKIASNNTIDFIRKRKAQTVSLDVDDINPEDLSLIHILFIGIV